MNTILQQTYSGSYSTQKPTIWSKFITWAEGQEKNWFAWLAVALTGHGTILAPLTILAVMLSGQNHMVYWALVMGGMGMSLVTYLAALPTKWTVPIFLLSVLIDILVIASLFVRLFGVGF